MGEIQNWAIVDNETNIVLNTCVWDGIEYDPITAPTAWQVPEGVTMIVIESGVACQTDDIYDPVTGLFSRPALSETSDADKAS